METRLEFGKKKDMKITGREGDREYKGVQTIPQSLFVVRIYLYFLLPPVREISQKQITKHILRVMLATN